MAYIHCDSCGAKALAGATRCPRCQKGFVEYDAKGNRISTVRCASCGVLRPTAIGACPNCNAGARDSAARSARSLIFVGIGIAVVIAGGYGISKLVSRGKTPVIETTVPPKDTTPVAAPVKRDTLSTADYIDSAMNASPASAASASLPKASVPAPKVAAPAPIQAPVQTPVQTPVATASLATPRVTPAPTPENGSWEYYAATTWVRVRSGPGREFDMTRMIDSSQRVRLGPSTGGWREVRVGKDHGWVDPRLFVPVVPPKP